MLVEIKICLLIVLANGFIQTWLQSNKNLLSSIFDHSIAGRFTLDRRREAFTLVLVLNADHVVNVFTEDTITAIEEDEFDINNRLRN